MNPGQNSPAERLTLSSGLIVRELSNYGELKQACQLYRGVFGYTGEDESLNPRMLNSLLSHSGSVVGAVDPSGTVLAFAYGWAAVETGDDAHIYHFSQAAVVSSVLQGQGVGRALKRVQAAMAQRSGAERMRWTYDPLLARNAHFNLDVLGARGRWYSPDAQGLPGTDRITVEWRFTDDDAAPDAPNADGASTPHVAVGELHHNAAGTHLGLPAAKPVDPDLAASLRQQIRGVFDQGLTALSCFRTDPHTAVYTFIED
ncbi:GNAT family N-acetyltransferase [Nesterenkonia haasae]|uniref:GNAT family N-acetyltransferase n=1 Tax=Nesterenkonia haasae TaxID=2587813 RepID=UPI0013910DB7|nr:GNAT family N-acetyltransferase [Nesterenkonia haasae]NDK31289.1 GNAT family N-acetyltransferase [Nesterenkonia haasae]